MSDLFIQFVSHFFDAEFWNLLNKFRVRLRPHIVQLRAGIETILKAGGFSSHVLLRAMEGVRGTLLNVDDSNSTAANQYLEVPRLPSLLTALHLTFAEDMFDDVFNLAHDVTLAKVLEPPTAALHRVLDMISIATIQSQGAEGTFNLDAAVRHGCEDERRIEGRVKAMVNDVHSGDRVIAEKMAQENKTAEFTTRATQIVLGPDGVAHDSFFMHQCQHLSERAGLVTAEEQAEAAKQHKAYQTLDAEARQANSIATVLSRNMAAQAAGKGKGSKRSLLSTRDAFSSANTSIAAVAATKADKKSNSTKLKAGDVPKLAATDGSPFITTFVFEWKTAKGQSKSTLVQLTQAHLDTEQVVIDDVMAALVSPDLKKLNMKRCKQFCKERGLVGPTDRDVMCAMLLAFKEADRPLNGNGSTDPALTAAYAHLSTPIPPPLISFLRQALTCVE